MALFLTLPSMIACFVCDHDWSSQAIVGMVENIPAIVEPSNSRCTGDFERSTMAIFINFIVLKCVERFQFALVQFFNSRFKCFASKITFISFFIWVLLFLFFLPHFAFSFFLSQHFKFFCSYQFFVTQHVFVSLNESSLFVFSIKTAQFNSTIFSLTYNIFVVLLEFCAIISFNLFISISTFSFVLSLFFLFLIFYLVFNHFSL